MENQKGSINAEIQLPEAIIQHIQSFFNGKEAAQTSILSKSWYSAWSTHPNVDFDQRYFANSRAVDGFAEFTGATLQRYANLNQKIKSLKLWMNSESGDTLATELIVKAMKLGATDLNLEFPILEPPFILSVIIPQEVLGSVALTSLSVTGCRFLRGVGEKVRCSKLKSLCLDNVMLGDVLWDIFSICPLEKLTITRCVYTSETRPYTRILALSPPITFGTQIVAPTFPKLKYLFLESVRLSSLFFSDFSSKFPCLKDLIAHECFGYEQLHICSNSLECISFVDKGKNALRASFDVPSIRKFSFSGTFVPVLSFQTTVMEWESDISFLHGEPGVLSVPNLKRLLKKLGQSKISLSLNIVLLSDKNFEYVGDVGDSPRPVVENLILTMMNAPSSVCSALLGCLFWSCRPKFITPYWLPESSVEGNASHNTVEILCRRLIQSDQNCYIANRRMFGQRDLEEVNVERLEEDVAVWRPLPWKSLLDASDGPENKQKIRFLLKWGQ